MSTPAVLAALAVNQQAQAAPLYWDLNGATASGNSTTTANGTWDTSTSNWSTESLGATAPVVWTTGSTAVFSAGTTVTGASTVTIAAGANIAGVAGITFEEGTVNIAGGDATSSLILTAPTITATAATSTISGILSGSAGLTKAGTGLLVLTNSNNNYTGNTLISGGTLRIANATALAGTAGATVTINSGSTLAVGYAIDQALIDRLASASAGQVALISTTNTANLDLSTGSLANVTIGALTGVTATYSGTLTPASNTYKLGGGGGTIVANTTFTAGNSIVVGGGTGTGTVNFLGSAVNQTTADLTITTGGTLTADSDADLGDNITNPAQAVQLLNGGVLNYSAAAGNFTHHISAGTGGGTWTIASNQTMAGNITGAGALTKNGAGTLVLPANQTGYTGALTVSAGKIFTNSTLGAGSISLSGTGSLSGVGTISNGGTLVTTTTGSSHIIPGEGATLAGNPTMTFDKLTLNSLLSFIDERIDGSTTGVNDQIVVSQSDGLVVTAGAGFNITLGAGTVTTGNTYTLLDYNGTPLADSLFTNNNLFINSAPAGFDYTLVNNTANTSIDLLVGAALSSTVPTWNVDGNANWSPFANWIGGAPNGTDATALFGTVITTTRTVTLDQNRTVGHLIFSSANRYVLGGTATLTMDAAGSGPADITFHDGTHNITANVALVDDTTMTVSGPLVTFNGVVSGSKTLTQTGTGTVQLNVAPTLTGAWIVDTNATLRSNTASTTVLKLPPNLINNGDVDMGTIITGVNFSGKIGGSNPAATMSIRNGAGAATNAVATFTGASTFPGTFYISRNIDFKLLGTGAFTGSGTLDLQRSNLFLDNASNNNSNRLPDTGTVRLRGAALTMTNGTGTQTETVGTLRVSSDGTSFLSMTPGGSGSVVLTAGQFVRDQGGVLLARGTNFGQTGANTTQLLFTTVPNTVTGLGTPSATPLTGILGSSNTSDNGATATLVTYDPAVGVRMLTTAEYYTGNAPTANANTNYAPAAASTITASTTLNAIEFGGASNIAATAPVGMAVSSGQTLTLSSGMLISAITSSNAATTISGGTVAFGTSAGAGEAIIEIADPSAGVNGANTLTISSVISSTGLTKIGNGTLVLGTSTNNLHGGLVSVNAGTLSIDNPNRLGGASAVNVGHIGKLITNVGYVGGILRLTGSNNYTLPITIAGKNSGGTESTTTQGALHNLSGTNTWSGSVALAGFEANSGATPLNTISAAAGTLVLSGVISDAVLPDGTSPSGSLAWTGQGDIVLTGTAKNTYTGFGRAWSGRVIVEKDGAFGIGNSAGDTLGQLMTTTSGLNRCTIAFRAPSSSSAGFNYTVDERIAFSGSGVANNGVQLANLGGANTFNGPVGFSTSFTDGVHTNPSVIDIAASSSLELSNTFGGGTASARSIIKQGAGQLILSANNNGTIIQGVAFGSGSIIDITAGGLTITGVDGQLPSGFDASASAYPGNKTITVREGANLTLDNSRGVNTSRINSAASIGLTGLGAELKLIGATAGVSQSVGNLSIASFSTITSVGAASGVTELTIPDFDNGSTRSNRGTVLFRGMDNSLSKIKITAAPTLQGGGGSGGSPLISILPSAVGDTSASGLGSDFVTVESNFVRALDASEYTPLVTSSSTKVNTTATGTVNITGGGLDANTTQVNSVKLNGGSTISIGSGKKLWVFSGGLLGVGTASSTITGGNLDFQQFYPAGDPQDQNAPGAFDKDPFSFTDAVGITDGVVPNSSNEAVITVPTGSTLIQDSSNVISGAEGLTKSGGGTLRLQGTNTFGQAKAFVYYDGTNAIPVGATTARPVTINAGRLEFNVDANLGATASPIFINGGTLAPQSASTSTRSISLASLGSNIIDAQTGADFTVNGVVSGNALTKNGGGTLSLNNTGNSYTGGTFITDGYVRVIPGTAGNFGHTELGTGAVLMNGGSLRFEDDTIFDRSLVINTTNTTGGFYIAPTKTVTFGSGSSSTNVYNGTGNIAIDGGGKLRLANVNGAQITHSGRYYVNNGSTLEYIPNNAATPNFNAGIGTPPGGVLWQLTNGSTLKFGFAPPTILSGFGGAAAGVNIGGTLGAAQTGTVDISAAVQFFTAGQLSGPGTLIKEGIGEYGFRGQSASSGGNTGFSGKFIINNGILSFGDQGVLAAGTQGEAMLGTGTGTGATPFIQMADGTEFLWRASGKALDLNANRDIALLGSTARIGSNLSSVTVRGVISGTNVTQLQVGGTGAVVFAGANTYTGDTLIKSTTNSATGTNGPTGGNLRMAGANSLPSTTTVHFNAQAATGSAILDLAASGTAAGFSQSIVTVVNDSPGVGTARLTNSGTSAATLNLTTASPIAWSDEITGANMFIGNSGAGGLTIGNNNNNFGGIDGTGNTVVTTATNNTIGRVRQNSLDIQGSATVKAIGVANLANATQSAAQTSRVGSVTLGSTAKWDLNNTKAIVTTPGSTGTWNGSAYDGITGLVQIGRNGGAWNGTRGIITSQSLALPANNSLTTLAVALASDTGKTTFGGQAVAGTDTLVMYTWNGDADLNGKVDADDYFQIDSNYNKSGSSFGFNKGDFNYDGQINGDDYFLIDNAYVGQNAVISAAPGAEGGDGGAGLSGVSAVPEPGALSLLGLAAVGGLRRRRRNK